MNYVIFTVYIDIPDDKIDNPGWYTDKGVLVSTDKSFITKQSFQQYKDKLIQAQQSYCKTIGCDYFVFTDDDDFLNFCKMFSEKYPQISQYDIINFYKHHVMAKLAEKYDHVCYFDLDIIPNTTDNIFEHFQYDAFVVPDSNEEAAWGKKTAPEKFTTSIRNPASKYWNAHAMLTEVDGNPDQNVYNTGIMLASRKIINQLNFFENFDNTLDLMTRVKNDPVSMYPTNIQRVFNYDNETAFSYKLSTNCVDVVIMDKTWHFPVISNYYDPAAKFYHVIDKNFKRFFR